MGRMVGVVAVGTLFFLWSILVLVRLHSPNVSSSIEATRAVERFHEEVMSFMPDPASMAYIPRCDRVVMYHDQKGNGLGAQVLRVLDAYLFAKQRNSTLLVARQMYWNYGCDFYLTWECYFEPVTPYCKTQDGSIKWVNMMVSPESCDMFRMDSYADKQCVIVADMIAEDHIFIVAHKGLTEQPDDSQAFKLTRENIRDVWKPNRSIRKKTEDAMRGMNLVPGGYIGVHIRRGDKALEVPLVPLEEYAQAVRLTGSESKIIFLATDDGSIIWEFAELLPEYLVYTFADPASQGHLQKRANEQRLAITVVSTMSLVAEIDMLRFAEYFIGTFSSNIGRLLAVLRDQPVEQAISLDVAWSTGAAWRSFNTNYCSTAGAHKAYCDWKRSKIQEKENLNTLSF